MGALAGGMAGAYGGHKINHGIIGGIGGAVAGSMLEDAYKKKHKKDKKHKQPKHSRRDSSSSSSSSSSSDSDSSKKKKHRVGTAANSHVSSRNVFPTVACSLLTVCDVKGHHQRSVIDLNDVFSNTNGGLHWTRGGNVVASGRHIRLSENGNRVEAELRDGCGVGCTMHHEVDKLLAREWPELTCKYNQHVIPQWVSSSRPALV